MTSVDPIIAQLRDRRNQRGLKPYVLAGLAGLSQQYVYRTEAGLHSPRLDTLRAWADALGYDLALVCRERTDERMPA
ncbi:helix-turn-helix domain-containing protein [Actinoplanes sp. SE50/110]|uniref:helix-turn-helix domain-containing protein n=1 Tax=unclassified Actinoplanes TaxID=2626549 RepID=UPI0005B97B7C